MDKTKQKLWTIIRSIIVLLFIIGLWEVLFIFGIFREITIPRPIAVFQVGVNLILGSVFALNITATIIHWLIALILGLLFGGTLGIFSGLSYGVSNITSTPLAFLRAMPPITLFPIALIALGPGGTPIIVVAALGAALYIFPGTFTSTKEASKRFEDLGQVLGCNRLQYIVNFVLPGAAIHVLSSTRVAATYAFAICVAAEMVIGGSRGIGSAILEYSELYMLEHAYVYVIFAGLVGILIDTVIGLINRLSIISHSSYDN